MKLVIALVAASSLNLATPAQTTWIVDATGRSGSFLDIQIAVDSAQTGDTIRVRPGRYRGFWIDGKGLAVLGETDQVLLSSGVVVDHVPASAATCLRNLGVLSGGLVMHDNAGAVHFDRVTVVDNTLVRGSALVSYHDCTVMNGAWFIKSNVQLTQCRIVAQGLHSGEDWGPGVDVKGGTVALQSCQVIGAPPSNLVFGASPGPGLEAHPGSRVTVAGLGFLAAGRGTYTAAVYVHPGATVTLGHEVLLVPNPGALTHTGEVVGAPVPWIELSAAGASGPLSGFASAYSFTTVGVLLSLPAPPQATPFGDLWLAPQVLLIDQGAATAGPRPFLVPLSAPVPPGTTVTFQAFGLRTGLLRLSTPATIVFGF